MARIRTIKPEMASDAKLASVSRDARYTFVLLITQADNHGLVPANTRQLLGALYPHEEDVTAEILLGWIAELSAIGVVRWRATKDGASIIELTNWGRHQRIDNAGKSPLAAALLPVDGGPAESRGGPPQKSADRETSQSLAESRGEETLDLGPRKGPRTEGNGPSAPPPPPAPARAHACEALPELPDSAMPDLEALLRPLDAMQQRSWVALLGALLSGQHPLGGGVPNQVSPEVLAVALREYVANGEERNFKRFKGYCRDLMRPPPHSGADAADGWREALARIKSEVDAERQEVASD